MSTNFRSSLVVGIVILLWGCTTPSEPLEPTPGLTAFTGGRIIVGNAGMVIENGTLIVRDGWIDKIGESDSTETPADAMVIDVSGKTIIPGLINAHGHVNDVRGLEGDPAFYTEEHVESQLGLYARYGVTTVFSLGGDGPPGMAVRDRQGPDLNHARLYVGGQTVTGPSPEDAVEQVNAVADSGANFVKIRVDDNLSNGSQKMSPETYKAVIDTAHERGLRVAAHLYALDDAKGLLESDVDFIAHSVRDKEIDDELIALMTEKDICLCPTLMREVSTFVYEERPDWFDDPFFLREAEPGVIQALEAKIDNLKRTRGQTSSTVLYSYNKSAADYKEDLRVAQHNLKALSDGGVMIAFGTDTGPPARFQGYFEHGELDLMVESGLTPMQAIVSATGDAARCMKVEAEIGTLEMGKRADFVVLGANPLDDISNSRTLESVWIAGNLVPGSETGGKL